MSLIPASFGERSLWRLVPLIEMLSMQQYYHSLVYDEMWQKHSIDEIPEFVPSGLPTISVLGVAKDDGKVRQDGSHDTGSQGELNVNATEFVPTGQAVPYYANGSEYYATGPRQRRGQGPRSHHGSHESLGSYNSHSNGTRNAGQGVGSDRPQRSGLRHAGSTGHLGGSHHRYNSGDSSVASRSATGSETNLAGSAGHRRHNRSHGDGSTAPGSGSGDPLHKRHGSGSHSNTHLDGDHPPQHTLADFMDPQSRAELKVSARRSHQDLAHNEAALHRKAHQNGDREGHEHRKESRKPVMCANGTTCDKTDCKMPHPKPCP